MAAVPSSPAAPHPPVILNVSVVLVPGSPAPTMGVRVSGDASAQRTVAFVAPGTLQEWIPTEFVAERVFCRISKDDALKRLEVLKKAYTARKFVPGTCDSLTFVVEAAKVLGEVHLPADAAVLSAWLQYKVQKQMKAVKVETNEMAFTNFVYISKEDEPLFVRVDRKPSYVRIRNTVCVVECNTKVPGGSVALNGPHRDINQIALGETVTVESFVPDESTTYQMNTVTFEVDYAIKTTSSADTFDAEAFARHLQQHYMKQFFVKGQRVIFSFGGVPFSGVVTDFDILTLDALVKSDAAGAGPAAAAAVAPVSRNLGMMGNQTVVKIVRKAGSNLKLKSQDDSDDRTNVIFKEGFSFEQLGIGGLDREFSDIFRRAFASRVFPKEVVRKLGIQHVKGLMLYGPPGCGKTLIARQIAQMLNAKDIQLVNGPEILSKYVGEAAANVRAKFALAEKEYKERGEDSDLHIIIFDEIDAICKQRGMVSDNTGTGDQVVNQLLSKMDGVEQLNNVLVIGMTNRLDLIDEALLRPGRFEIHMQISLPDEGGRLQILRIHTTKMRESHMMGDDVRLETLAAATKNFSGAEIAGLVRSATAFAMYRKLDLSNMKRKIDTDIKVTMDDFTRALSEVRPAFGVDQDDFAPLRPFGIINYGPEFSSVYQKAMTFVEQMRSAKTNSLLTVLLSGEHGCGKTALAATLALESGFPFVRLIAPDSLLDYTEQTKCQRIHKAFEDAYKSPLSIVVVDDLEQLIEYVDSGPRFSNAIRQTLSVLIRKTPPPGHKVLVIGTTSAEARLRAHHLGLVESFDFTLRMPLLTTVESVASVLRQSGKIAGTEAELSLAAQSILLAVSTAGIDVRRLLKAIDLMAHGSGEVNASDFAEAFADSLSASAPPTLSMTLPAPE